MPDPYSLGIAGLALAVTIAREIIAINRDDSKATAVFRERTEHRFTHLEAGYESIKEQLGWMLKSVSFVAGLQLHRHDDAHRLDALIEKHQQRAPLSGDELIDFVERLKGVQREAVDAQGEPDWASRRAAELYLYVLQAEFKL